jgi:hypothetical protein
MRILIAGGPKTGKTTLAEKLREELGLKEPDIFCGHDEELVGKMDWSAQSAEVATWFDTPDPWIIEGVSVGRALRKWLKAHPEGKPADRVIYLKKPVVKIEKAQETMAKGCWTVWSEIYPEILRRGIQVEYLDPDMEPGMACRDDAGGKP